MKKWMWFSSGLCVGLVSLSLAVGSVPSGPSIPKSIGEGTSLSESLSDDTVLYQDLSDIRVKRAKLLDFDGDIASLEAREKRYRERLPLVSSRKGAKASHRKTVPGKAVKKKRPRRSSRVNARRSSSRMQSRRYRARTQGTPAGVKPRASARSGSSARSVR